jgi:beta-glucanase (GH16 family)
MRKAILFFLMLLLLSGCGFTASAQEDKSIWKLTFEDTFDGGQVDPAKWQFQLGTGAQEGLTQWGNNEQQSYQAENAVLANGLLTLYAKQESGAALPYTSARLCTRDLFSQCYGRFEARIRLPHGEGFWPAFWLLPQDSVYGGWAASGEIDIMEFKGRNPEEILHTIHFGGAWPNNAYAEKTVILPKGTREDFHMYALEWEEGELRWYIDDTLTCVQTDWRSDGHPFPAPFDQPFYMILNLAVGGNFDQNVMPGRLGGPMEGQLEIDYVRVYQRAGEGE